MRGRMESTLECKELQERRYRLHQKLAKCDEEKIRALRHLLTELSKSQALLIAMQRGSGEYRAN